MRKAFEMEIIYTSKYACAVSNSLQLTKNISIIYNRIQIFDVLFSVESTPHSNRSTYVLHLILFTDIRNEAINATFFFLVQMPTHFRPYHSVLLILILAVIGWINGFRRACFKCTRPTNLRLRVQSGFFYFHLIMTLTFAKRMDGCYPYKQTSTPPSPQPIRLGKRLFLYRPFHFFTFFIFHKTNMCVMFLI